MRSATARQKRPPHGDVYLARLRAPHVPAARFLPADARYFASCGIRLRRRRGRRTLPRCRANAARAAVERPPRELPLCRANTRRRSAAERAPHRSRGRPAVRALLPDAAVLRAQAVTAPRREAAIALRGLRRSARAATRRHKRRRY